MTSHESYNKCGHFQSSFSQNGPYFIWVKVAHVCFPHSKWLKNVSEHFWSNVSRTNALIFLALRLLIRSIHAVVLFESFASWSTTQLGLQVNAIHVAQIIYRLTALFVILMRVLEAKNRQWEAKTMNEDAGQTTGIQQPKKTLKKRLHIYFSGHNRI